MTAVSLDVEPRTLRRGKERLAFAMDKPTWAAIELVAAQAGVKWTEWARGILDAQPNAASKAALLRAAAFNELAMAVQGDAEQAFADVEHPLEMYVFHAQDRQTFLDEKKRQDVQLSTDDLNFGGFRLTFAYHEGKPALFIENKILGEPSAVIVANLDEFNRLYGGEHGSA